MAPLYHQLLDACERHDDQQVQQLQAASSDIIADLFEVGFLPSVRVLMEDIGIRVGPPRLPLLPLAGDKLAQLREKLAARNFQQWRERPGD
jgi:dihydrodipicolinate synthase/N-acetylneuraminate lyase